MSSGTLFCRRSFWGGVSTSIGIDHLKHDGEKAPIDHTADPHRTTRAALRLNNISMALGRLDLYANEGRNRRNWAETAETRQKQPKLLVAYRFKEHENLPPTSRARH